VDGDAISRALGFLDDYAVPMARRAFGEAALPEAERDARRLARWILRQSPTPARCGAWQTGRASRHLSVSRRRWPSSPNSAGCAPQQGARAAAGGGNVPIGR
jgi:hypothetical protein